MFFFLPLWSGKESVVKVREQLLHAEGSGGKHEGFSNRGSFSKQNEILTLIIKIKKNEMVNGELTENPVEQKKTSSTRWRDIVVADVANRVSVIPQSRRAPFL